MRGQLSPESVRQHHQKSIAYGAGLAAVAAAGIAAKRLGFIPPALIRETGTIYNKFDSRRRFLVFNSQRPLSAVEEKLSGVPYIGKHFRTAISSVHDEPGADKLAYTIPKTTQLYRQRLEHFRNRMSDWLTNHADPLNVLGRQKKLVIDPLTGKRTWQRGIPRVVLALEKLEMKTEQFGRGIITKIKKRFLDPTVSQRTVKKALALYRKNNKDKLDLIRKDVASKLRLGLSEAELSDIAATSGIHNRAVAAANKAMIEADAVSKRSRQRLVQARHALDKANKKLSKIQLAGVVTPQEQKKFKLAKRARRFALRDWKRAGIQGDKDVKAAVRKAEQKHRHAQSIDMADLLAEQHVEKHARKDVMHELSTKYTSPAQRLANRIIDPAARRVRLANDWLHKKALRFGRWLELPGMKKKRAS